ncbi:MAG: cell division protein FtsL [Treponema sp.]|jgi:cell division protein FtsB|nr:cell division protein FtsL [Treponema sp.]
MNMFRRYLLLYFIVLTIPLLLGTAVWQAERYAALERTVRTMEAEQEEWVESNKKLIAGIAVLSSSERIEYIAVHDLGLVKIRPEDVLQIRIDDTRRARGGKGIDG